MHRARGAILFGPGLLAVVPRAPHASLNHLSANPNGSVDVKKTPADVVWLYARPSAADSRDRRAKISTFIVDRSVTGYSVGQKIHDKLGVRASNTAELVFDNCLVPHENLVGLEGESGIHMMRNLELERLTLAAMSVGIARRCVEVMTAYSGERQSFGKPLYDFGQIQRHIAESYAEYRAAKAYLYETARRLELSKGGNRLDSDGVKLFASTAAKNIADRAIQTEEEGVRDRGRRASALGGSRALGSLRFEDVSFTYPTAPGNAEPGKMYGPALTDVSFAVDEGETVAIVGHTGAGKTTVTNLLFRFYEPSKGRILLGGESLAMLPKREARGRSGVVQQDVFLFSGTLRENLALLREGLTDRAILEGCARTGFDRVVRRLPKGLDTQLDERGANLSLGERQILAFTRVFLQCCKPTTLFIPSCLGGNPRGQ